MKVRYGMFPQGLYDMNITGMWVDEAYDPFYNRATWELKFLLWPQQCALSNKRLWLCRAYQGTAMWTGPGDPVYEFKYHSPQEHLIWSLKK